MNQQSQAQAQAQISALQQQNAMLNQHLQTQAQSHINHLQQLIPFHQPPQPFPPTSAAFQSTPQTPVPQAPDPPAPTATPANQPGSSTTFNRDEMLQQMKSTVESSIQAMVEKTQERQVHPTPPPSLPGATSSHPTSHHPSILQHPPPRQRSSRRSRSHHQGSPTRRPDKRPASIRRSPRRRRSSRRPRRSSRNRSCSRSPTRPQHESPRKDRERSITLRSASPPRRGDRQPVEEYHQPHDYSSNTPTLQASSWWKSQHSTGYNNPTQRMIPIILSSLPVTSGNRGASGRTTPRIPLPCINLHGMIPRSLPIAIPPPPMTLPPNHSQHSPPPSQHLHATRKASLTLLEMINLKSQCPYPQDTCSSISGMDQKQNESGLSSSVSVTKIE